VTPKACEEYRRRLDRADPGALRDSHAGECAECEVERRAAETMMRILAQARPAAVPASFAARVAYLAHVEAAAERSERALRAASVPPGFVTAVVTVAIATCVPVAIPVIARYFAAGARGLPLPSVQELAPVAVAWFTFAAILAADLTRRLRPA